MRHEDCIANLGTPVSRQSSRKQTRLVALQLGALGMGAMLLGSGMDAIRIRAEEC